MKRVQRSLASWPRLAMDAQAVIALRLARLATGGPAGQRELRRMWTEKLAAAVEAQFAMALAAARGPFASLEAGQKPVRRRVRSNLRRLSRR